MYNLRNQKIDFNFRPQYVTREIHTGKLTRSRCYSGDLIMNIVRPPLGKLAIVPDSLLECNINQAAVVIRSYCDKLLLNKYLWYFLWEMSAINSITTKGNAGQYNISLSQCQDLLVPLPPIEEIEKIVSFIDSLFELIDHINYEQTSLHAIIAKTKSKILSLAIQGKLVRQAPGDEPAIDMLRRINPDFRPCDKSHYPFMIPSSWEWVELRELLLPMKRDLPKGKFFKYIDIDSVNNSTNSCTPKKLPSVKAPSRANRFTKNGDIVFSMVRPYLRNIAKVPEEGCIASTGFYICSANEKIDETFLFHLLLSDYVLGGLNDYMKGDNSPSINSTDIESSLILPPQ